MYLFLIPHGQYEWDARASDQSHFDKPKDSPSKYFHTLKQFMMFRGGLDRRDLYKKHRWVSWVFLNNFPQMASAVNAFKDAGLSFMMEMR